MKITLQSLVCLVLATAAQAQQLAPITLDDLLLRLESNLNHYEQAVPSFICDEHLVSRLDSASHPQSEIADSVFRLKRIANPDGTSSFDESRQINTIDGHPAQSSDQLQGPFRISGAFSGGLAVVSIHQSACMHYSLEPLDPTHPEDPYVVRFETISTPAADPDRPADCLLHEPATGQVFVDPNTMQIVHMELNAPRHTLSPATSTPDGNELPPIIGEWALAIDYAPVELDGETFFTPATIRSRATAYGLEPSPQGRATTTRSAPATVWSFRGTYTNYHKLEVTSHILPATPE